MEAALPVPIQSEIQSPWRLAHLGMVGLLCKEQLSFSHRVHLPLIPHHDLTSVIVIFYCYHYHYCHHSHFDVVIVMIVVGVVVFYYYL